MIFPEMSVSKYYFYLSVFFMKNS